MGWRLKPPALSPNENFIPLATISPASGTLLVKRAGSWLLNVGDFLHQ